MKDIRNMLLCCWVEVWMRYAFLNDIGYKNTIYIDIHLAMNKACVSEKSRFVSFYPSSFNGISSDLVKVIRHHLNKWSYEDPQ